MLVAALLASSQAHFPLATGASFGSRFSTLATAMEVEDITRSQSTSRIAFCSSPYFWFKLNVPSGFTKMMVGGTVPVLLRFEDTRVAVALIGPGLPIPSLVQLPLAVQSQVPPGMGALVVPGRPDQSRCDWMEDPLSRRAYSAQPGSAARSSSFQAWATKRCFFYEPFGGLEHTPFPTSPPAACYSYAWLSCFMTAACACDLARLEHVGRPGQASRPSGNWHTLPRVLGARRSTPRGS